VAKGLTSGYIPMGATLISDNLFEQISGSRAGKTPYFTNGFTYSGHPVSCAAALKNLEIIKRENLCHHVKKKVGPHFIKKLKTLEHFDSVGEVRGMHLMACVEFQLEKHKGLATKRDIDFARKVDELCEIEGLIVRPYENLCILSPPLIINTKEIDTIVSILENCIMQVEKTFE
jgi:adenosylmethionine-8-amino-7-oxononanoate aminotransferase